MAGQVWLTNSLGGFFYARNLSDELREALQPMVKFRQFADVKDASQQGRKKGDIFTYDVVSNVATKGSTLVETNTMPETQFTITQSTLTITEAGNSVPYSGKLEDLSKFAVRRPLMNALRNDAKKVFDILAWTEFDKTLLRAVETATSGSVLTTDGTATVTNSRAFQKEHADDMMVQMRERNIPPYQGDDYYAIAWPSAYNLLRSNLDTIHQYTEEGLRMIMNGEIGRYHNIRFVEQTHIPKGGANDSTTHNAYTDTADAWNNGTSDWIFFCGEDTVAEGIAVPEEIRSKIPTDYGRSKGVAWYYLGGFGLVHSGTASEARIIKWDSAV